MLTLWTRQAYIYAWCLLPLSTNSVFIRLRYSQASTTQKAALRGKSLLIFVWRCTFTASHTEIHYTHSPGNNIGLYVENIRWHQWKWTIVAEFESHRTGQVTNQYSRTMRNEFEVVCLKLFFFLVADHDHTKCSMVPSVALVPPHWMDHSIEERSM